MIVDNQHLTGFCERYCISSWVCSLHNTNLFIALNLKPVFLGGKFVVKVDPEIYEHRFNPQQ